MLPEEKLLTAIFGERLEDSEYRSEVNGVTLLQAVEVSLSTLTPRQIAIVRMRFGFDDPDGCAMTYKQVGEAFYVTGERIRQVTMNALRHLRHKSHSTRLKPYLKSES